VVFPASGGGGLVDDQFLYGTGVDGDIVISAPTTLTGELYANTLVVEDELNVANWRIFARESVTVASGGVIGAIGADSTSGLGGTGWGATAVFPAFGGGASASAAAAGVTGSIGQTGVRMQGGAGGASDTGATVTNGTVTPALEGRGSGDAWSVGLHMLRGMALNNGGDSFARVFLGNGGAGGRNGSTGSNAGGGAAGGAVIIVTPHLVNDGYIGAPGGDGHAATLNTGSGGGGGGGLVAHIGRTRTGGGTFDVAGGVGGVGGFANGANGFDGLLYLMSEAV
jgi:hypothetical protein